MNNKKHNPKYAPGMGDRDIVPAATEEDRKNSNVTVETRVFLDENDPSGRKNQS